MSMSHLRYFKPEKPEDSTRDGLTNPKGSLSTTIPSSAIESANELVREAQKAQAIKHLTRPEIVSQTDPRYESQAGADLEI